MRQFLSFFISFLCFINIFLFFNNSSWIAEESTDAKFIQVSAGEGHCVALKSDGTVWAWGRGIEGQLGNGQFLNSKIPVQVIGLENISYVVAGGRHNLAMNDAGDVWAWGYDNYGQLGIGSHENKSVPVQIDYSKCSPYTVACTIDAGYEHSLIRTYDTVLSFGRNREGQLANLSCGYEKQRVGNVKGYSYKNAASEFILSISAGGNRSYLGARYQYEKKMYYLGWGENIAAEPEELSSNYVQGECLLTSGGNNYAIFYKNGDIDYYENDIMKNYSLKNLKNVKLGYDFGLALDNLGDVYTFGNSFYGDEKVNSRLSKINISNIESMTAGKDFAIFIDNDGNFWGLGNNNYGQLGNGTTEKANEPVKGMTMDFEMNETVLAVSAGYNHTLAIKKDGTVWAWGNNDCGQLGNGTMENSYVPVQVKGLTDVVEVSAGYDFSIARKKDGTVWAWGNNDYGQLGNGTNKLTNVPIQVSLTVSAKSITAGYDHCGIVAIDQTAWTWGRNDYGQLGDKTNINKFTPVKISLTCLEKISAGKSFTMLLKHDGTLYTFGRNDYGQLGGKKAYNNKPISIMIDVKGISAGETHALAIKRDGTVYTCGYNLNGCLALGTNTNQIDIAPIQGISDIVSVEAGKNVSYALKLNGQLLFWGDSETSLNYGSNNYLEGNRDVFIINWGNIRKISSGSGYQMIIKEDGTLWGFGYNDYGQLGIGTTLSKYNPNVISWGTVKDLYPSKGKGTVSDPYLIYDINDFDKIGNNLTAHYKLVSDLDFKNLMRVPIGNLRNAFKGSLDGNGKTLSNLKIDFPNMDNVGLFGCTENAVIKNLNIINAEVTGRTNTGTLVGKMNGGSLTGCTIVRVKNLSLVGLAENNAYISENQIIENSQVEEVEKTIDVEKGKNNKIILTVDNMPFIKSTVYKIEYDALKVQPVAIGEEYEENNAQMVKVEKGIKVIYDKDGLIKFTIDRDDKNWSGALVPIIFEGLETGSTTIKFEVE